MTVSDSVYDKTTDWQTVIYSLIISHLAKQRKLPYKNE